MATLDELEQSVIKITKRPDQSARIRKAIKTATLKAHRKGFFARDLDRDLVVLSQAANSGVFDISTQFPLLRKILAVYPVIDGKLQNPLTVVDADNLIGHFGTPKADIYYQSGEEINFHTSYAYQSFVVVAYNNPNVSDSAYSSWVANNYEDCITFEASRQVLASIGKEAEANSLEKNRNDSYAELIRDNLEQEDH